MVCHRCRGLIGNAYRKYTNEDKLTFVWHPECWEKARVEILYAYLECIRKAKEKS